MSSSDKNIWAKGLFERSAKTTNLVMGMTFLRLMPSGFQEVLRDIKSSRHGHVISLNLKVNEIESALMSFFDPNGENYSEWRQKLFQDIKDIADIYAQTQRASTLILSLHPDSDSFQSFVSHGGLRIIYDTSPGEDGWALFRMDGKRAKLSKHALFTDIDISTFEEKDRLKKSQSNIEFLARLEDYKRELARREYPGASEISPQLLAKLMNIEAVNFEEGSPESDEEVETDKEEGQGFGPLEEKSEKQEPHEAPEPKEDNELEEAEEIPEAEDELEEKPEIEGETAEDESEKEGAEESEKERELSEGGENGEEAELAEGVEPGEAREIEGETAEDESEKEGAEESEKEGALGEGGENGEEADLAEGSEPRETPEAEGESDKEDVEESERGEEFAEGDEADEKAEAEKEEGAEIEETPELEGETAESELDKEGVEESEKEAEPAEGGEANEKAEAEKEEGAELEETPELEGETAESESDKEDVEESEKEAEPAEGSEANEKVEAEKEEGAEIEETPELEGETAESESDQEGVEESEKEAEPAEGGEANEKAEAEKEEGAELEDTPETEGNDAEGASEKTQEGKEAEANGSEKENAEEPTEVHEEKTEPQENEAGEREEEGLEKKTTEEHETEGAEKDQVAEAADGSENLEKDEKLAKSEEKNKLEESLEEKPEETENAQENEEATESNAEKTENELSAQETTESNNFTKSRENLANEIGEKGSPPVIETKDQPREEFETTEKELVETPHIEQSDKVVAAHETPNLDNQTNKAQEFQQNKKVEQFDLSNNFDEKSNVSDARSDGVTPNEMIAEKGDLPKSSDKPELYRSLDIEDNLHESIKPDQGYHKTDTPQANLTERQASDVLAIQSDIRDDSEKIQPVKMVNDTHFVEKMGENIKLAEQIPQTVENSLAFRKAAERPEDSLSNSLSPVPREASITYGPDGIDRSRKVLGENPQVDIRSNGEFSENLKLAFDRGAHLVEDIVDGNDTLQSRISARLKISLSDRLYSTMTSTIPVTAFQLKNYSNAQSLLRNSLSADPAHDVAVALLNSKTQKVLKPLSGLHIRYPNMNHSFGTMFTSMPALLNNFTEG